MKNKKDIYIKYLDNQLTTDERKEFEILLSEDQKIKLDFEQFVQDFDLTKKRIAVDERYFETLLPKARERITNRPENYFLKFAYIATVVIIGMVIFSIFNLNTTQTDKDLIKISELLEKDVNLSEEELKNVIDIDEYYSLDDQVLEIYFDDYLEMDETLFEYLELNLASNEISNSFLEDLSESEFRKIYKELENKHMIGEK